jgi:hypothetical protein
MALPEATSEPVTERPAGWRATWRDPKPRRAETRAVERVERARFSGPIPPPAELRDEALRALLALMRDGENEVIRFSAARLVLVAAEEAEALAALEGAAQSARDRSAVT